MTNEVIERTLTDPDYLIQLATAKKWKKRKRVRKAKKKTGRKNNWKTETTCRICESGFSYYWLDWHENHGEVAER